MTYTELYNQYSALWLKTRRLRKGHLINKLRAIPYRKRRDEYIGRVFTAIKSLTEFPNLSEAGNPDIVVSITSYPLRIETLHLVIKSILTQDMLPGKISLWLSKAQFPNELEDLPTSLVELMPYGLEISFFEGVDMRPHNKYYHAFKRYSDKVVITVDDDIVYAPHTISRLWGIYQIFPDAVCTNRMRAIRFDGNNDFAGYRKWARPTFSKPTQSMLFTALGYTGVLYPPGSYTETLFDKDLLMELAPVADDLWLKATQVVAGVPVAVAEGEFASQLELPNTQSASLRLVNDGESKNDEQWAKLDKYFGLKKILLNYKK